MGVIGILIGAVLMGGGLVATGGDPTVFLRIGEASPGVATFAEQTVGPVVLLPQLGHDGRFFFVQAADPWITDPDLYQTTLDFPAYRARRVGYPLLAGGFGLFPVRFLPWTLAIVNVAAFGLGTWVTSRLAGRLGLSPLFGLAFLANPGMFNEFFVSGAGIVALAFGLWGIEAAYGERWWLAGGLFVGAALAREVMLLTVFGVAALLFVRRRSALLPVLVPPMVVEAAWTSWVWWRLGADVSGARVQIGVPFVGLSRAVTGWLNQPGIELAMAAVLVTAGIVVLTAAIRRPGYLSWGTVGFALVAPLLSRVVWQQTFDMSRALAPLFTAAVLLGAARAFVHARPIQGSAQGPAGTVEDMA